MIRFTFSKSAAMFGLLGMLAVSAAGQENGNPPQAPAAPPSAGQKDVNEIDVNQIMLTLDNQIPTVKAAYMGVGVEIPSETIRSQLKLPEGSALVVNYVDEQGPSKDLLRKHDVLQKLNDQILINGEQLQVLVRMHKPGDAVQLTLIREAQPMVVAMRLAEKQLAPLRVGAASLPNLSPTWTTVQDAAGHSLSGAIDPLTVTYSAIGAATTQPVLSPQNTINLSTVSGLRIIARPTETIRTDDRAAVLRRLAIDITGTPPTPEEIQAFVSDKSPDAYEKVINRLVTNAPTTFTVTPKPSEPPATPAK